MNPELGDWGLIDLCIKKNKQKSNYEGASLLQARSLERKTTLDTRAGWAAGRATAWAGLSEHHAQMGEGPAGGERGSDSEYVLKAEEIRRS